MRNYVSNIVKMHQYPCFENDKDFQEKVIDIVTQKLMAMCDNVVDDVINETIDEVA